MPLDTSIIRQATFQPIQFKSPDRVNMLLQAAQAANQLQELQEAPQRRAQYALQVEQQKREVDRKIAEQSLGQYFDALSRTQNAGQARGVIALGFKDPGLAPVLGRFTTPEQAMAVVPDEPAQFNDWLRTQVLTRAERFKERTGAQRYISAGQGRVFDTQTGSYVDMPAAEAPAVTGAAAPRLSADQTDRILTQQGYRRRPDGTLEPIPGGRADPETLRRQAEAKRGPERPATEKPTLNEQQAATATARILRRATEISDALKRNPEAEAPGAIEAGIQNLPGLSIATNLVRSTDRQIVATAQDDVLDALLYLATGAAYNREQLQQQKSAYLSSWSDDAATRATKRQRLADMVRDAKIRAGRAWTPELDKLMTDLLQSPTMRPRTGRAGAPSQGGAGVDRNNSLLK